jgi:serine/alanine adding enzyme
MWDVIKWGAGNGYGVLDFGGAGKPGEIYGVRDFKAKFNGRRVNYGRNTHVHAPLRMKVSETAYQVARSSLYTLHRLGNSLSNSHSR